MGELGDTERSREHAEGEANRVILIRLAPQHRAVFNETYLVNEDEEESVDKNGPDEDVSEDAGHQVIGVGDHESTIPVNGNKGPGQRARDHGSVDETRICIVAEVERRKVEEVEHENYLSPVEVRIDKEQDKTKMEEIVHDKVTSNAGGSVDNVGVSREEMADVAGLKDEEEDPMGHVRSGHFKVTSDSPVDGGDGGIQGKGRGIQGVQVPDALADLVAIVRLLHGVIDGDDDGEDPGKERQDLVCEDDTR